MRRLTKLMLAKFLLAVFMSVTALAAATADGVPGPGDHTPTPVAGIQLAGLPMDIDRTQRVLDQFNSAPTQRPIQLVACTNACRQNCAQVYSSCVGSGGRPGQCSSHRSRCLSSCGC